jgi:hypothetical protein
MGSTDVCREFLNQRVALCEVGKKYHDCPEAAEETRKSFSRKTEKIMKTASITVQKEFCGECSLALMHFVKKIRGIESVIADNGKVIITFDEGKISEQEVLNIARQSIATMGYRVED